MADNDNARERMQQDQPPIPTSKIPRPQTPELYTSVPALASVREQINELFSLEELRSLTFDLGINYDNLAGQTLDGKIVSLLTYTAQHNQLPTLENRLKELRPHAIWLFPNQISLTTNLQVDRNRTNFLNNLKTTWIDGFLYQSLHSEVIKLTMSKSDDNVLARQPGQRSWQMVKQEMGKEDKLIALDKPIVEVFNECGRGLLILGDPGSGKTITLLQLADALITEANLPGQPMPVVLNLSSWAQKKQELTVWLVDEIFVQYGVGRNLARHWIENNSFIYLLDGLVEVAAEARNDCVSAINEFRSTQHGMVEIVVCSRIADYESLTQRLNLNTAIQIQPLSDAQVDGYLLKSNFEMKAVRTVLKNDSTLRELTRSPLLLNVMILAYQGKNIDDLQSSNTIDARRQHLFDTYTNAMFTRRPLPFNYPYSEEKARHWLIELAWGQTEHNVSEFYVEKLQPSWLPPGKPRRINNLINRLIIGLTIGMIFGFSITLIFGFVANFVGGVITGSGGEPVFAPMSGRILFSGLFLGLIIGLIGGLNDGRLSGLSAALSGGLIGGVIGAWFIEQSFNLGDGFNASLIGGLIAGLSAGISIALSVYFIGIIVNSLNKNDTQIATIEELRWHGPSFRTLLTGITNEVKRGYGVGQGVGIVGGIIGGLIAVLSLGLSMGLNAQLSAEFENGLFDIVFYGMLIFGGFSYISITLISLISGAVIGGIDACFLLQETQQKTRPNQGIRSSFRNFWRMSLLYILLLGGIGTLLSLPFNWWLFGANKYGFTGTGFFVLLFVLYGFWHSFMKYGGITIIQHYVLRWVMARYNILPFPLHDKKLISYLDAMVERILLRRTGNGYIFIHRSLMEHFAVKHKP